MEPPKRMRVLVVNPPSIPFTDRGLLIEPIDTLGLATFVQHLGHDVGLVDMDVLALHASDVETRVSDFRPDVVVVPFDYHIPLHTNGCAPEVNALTALARAAGAEVVLGGKMAQHYPTEFAASEPVIVHGEMEPALAELFALPRGTWASRLGDIAGVTYFRDGAPVHTRARHESIDLDTLPIADRSLVDLDNYIDVRTLLSSRGCQLRCSFCPTPSFWGAWRGRSATSVADEIEYLVRDCDARKILFLDDNTTVSKPRMRELSRLLIERGVSAALGCLGAVVTYDRSTVDLMAEAGFRWIHYGAESGDDAVLAAAHKRITSTELRAAIIGTKKAGIRVRTSWIFDLPGMGADELERTTRLILETQPQEVRAHFLSLRAGSELHQALSDNGFVSQFIHHGQPRPEADRRVLLPALETLVRELEALGYLVVRDPSEWRDVEALRRKSPDLRFISFCPGRYGLNWEA